ncbi:hypothetical protein [Kribbella sp. VKM Ac-2568]|uniref:hypothetical protein n=1 Tax=Kribbella sp. VKM Ac-2568 TaxID=2512219 RepID=UPI00130533D2|nr:hypothetical protein [Kribbella sp. VKM Ac-2568]
MSLAVDFSGLGDINLETVIAAIALIGTVIVWLVDRYFLRRKRLVYRVQVDAPIGVFPSSHMVDVEVRYQGAVVPDPSIVLLRVDNAGGMDIEPHHMHEKVSFAFPDRKIVGLEVTEAKPEALGEMLQRQRCRCSWWVRWSRSSWSTCSSRRTTAPPAASRSSARPRWSRP